MASGYVSNGVDLDNIFSPLGTANKVPDVGFKVSGVDISNRYYPLQAAPQVPPTGFLSRGVDLNQIFGVPGGPSLHYRSVFPSWSLNYNPPTPASSYTVPSVETVYVPWPYPGQWNNTAFSGGNPPIPPLNKLFTGFLSTSWYSSINKVFSNALPVNLPANGFVLSSTTVSGLPCVISVQYSIGGAYPAFTGDYDSFMAAVVAYLQTQGKDYWATCTASATANGYYTGSNQVAVVPLFPGYLALLGGDPESINPPVLAEVYTDAGIRTLTPPTLLIERAFF